MNTIKRSVPAWLLLSLLSVPLVLFLYRQVQQVVVRHEIEGKTTQRQKRSFFPANHPAGGP